MSNPQIISKQKTVSFDDTAIAFADKSDFELRKMYWLFSAMNSNFLVKTGTFALQITFKIRFPFVKNIVKNTIFEHFCGGETIQDCEKTIQKLQQSNIGTILDYSVEGAKDEAGFEVTTQEIIDTIEKAAGNPAIPFSVFKVTGIADAELLAKIQRKEPLSEAETLDFDHVKERVERICRRAYEKNVRLFFDGEESWIQDTIDDLAYQMMERFNYQKAIIYNTYQFYRHDMLTNLRLAGMAAEEKGYFLGAKLVRGAYMEKERREAEADNRKDPIQPDKEATDRDFDEGLAFCVQHYPRIALCAGTHNEKSIYQLMAFMQENGIKPADEAMYFAQLYGMSDNLSYNLAHAGYKVVKYVPYGPVEAVMPYLFRRANENTAIAGQSSRELLLIKKEIQRRKLIK
jgi:proline dehydrogenase